MAKADLFKNKLFGGLIKTRCVSDTARQRRYRCYKRCVFNIKNNDALLIFPEGHRIKNGKRVKAKLGVSMIAVYAKVPVIPLCISGEYKPFHKVTVTFGKPITFEEYYGKSLIMKLCRHLPMKLYRQFIRLTIQILRKIGEQK